jgi:hypothetical protein
VLVDQRLAEQPVRRQQPDQRRPLEPDAGAVLEEQRRRDRLAVTDHHVRLVALGDRVHAFEGVVLDPVVVVDEQHEIPARHVHADVARPAWPAGVGDVLDAHVSCSCSRASASSRAGVSSVEPSSTKIASYSPGASDWSSSDRMQSSMARPGL